MVTRGRIVLSFLVLATAICAGCGQEKFTRVRYEFLSVGATQQEVAETLGEPETRAGDTWTYVNRKGEYYRAVIRFEDGRIVDKQWRVSRTVSTEPAAPSGP